MWHVEDTDPTGFRSRPCGNHYGLRGIYLERIPEPPTELGSPPQCRPLQRIKRLWIKSWI